MPRNRLYISLFVGLWLIAGCASEEVCPGTWMTFFVDELEIMTDEHSGTVCAKGSTCRTLPGVWAPCPSNMAKPLCGSADAWLCLGKGEFSYEIYRVDQPNVPVLGGIFTMPAAKSGDCQARVYLSDPPRVETLTCTPDPPPDLASGTSNSARNATE